MFSERIGARLKGIRELAQTEVNKGALDSTLVRSVNFELIEVGGSVYFADEYSRVATETLNSFSFDVDRESFINKKSLDWLVDNTTGIPDEEWIGTNNWGVHCVAQGVLLARKVLEISKRVSSIPQISYITLDLEEDPDFSPSSTFRFTTNRFGLLEGGEWSPIGEREYNSDAMAVWIGEDSQRINL